MSEALVMAEKLEHQVNYGSYDWERVEALMLKASSELRRLAAVEKELEALKLAISEAEPVMLYHGCCVIDCGEHGHHHVEMLKMIPKGSPLYTLKGIK